MSTSTHTSSHTHDLIIIIIWQRSRHIISKIVYHTTLYNSTSHHSVSSHLISYYLISSHAIRYHTWPSFHIIAYHIIQCRIIISYHYIIIILLFWWCYPSSYLSQILCFMNSFTNRTIEINIPSHYHLIAIELPCPA